MGAFVVTAVLVVSSRQARRPRWPRADLQPRICGLHGVLDSALALLVAGRPGGLVADPDAPRSGSRRRDALRELGRDHHGRVPRGAARVRARDQRHRRDVGGVPRACDRRATGARGLAVDLLVSVPFGLFGTIWAYRRLRELAPRHDARMDWWGNATFAAGLIALMVAITYGIQPYGGSSMGWSSPIVIGDESRRPCSARCLCADRAPRRRPDVPSRAVPHPGVRRGERRDPVRRDGTWRVPVRDRHLAAGDLAPAPRIRVRRHAALGRDHDAAVDRRLPVVAAAPISGFLSDRHGARRYATLGMAISTACFVWLLLLPVDFSYPQFAIVLFLEGVGMGLFSSPNRAAVMNCLPARERGGRGGMNSTLPERRVRAFDRRLLLADAPRPLGRLFPATCARDSSPTASRGRDAERILAPPAGRDHLRHVPRVQPRSDAARQTRLLGSVPPRERRTLVSRSFFPRLIAGPFHTALVLTFLFAIASCVLSALGSLARGARYDAGEHEPALATAQPE